MNCNPDLIGRILKSDQSGRSSFVLLFRKVRGEKYGVRRLRVLSDLEVGESGVLEAMDLPPGVQNHLMYMGFVPDVRVKALHRAPAGDPTVYSVDGIEIALRRETARAIRVHAVGTESAAGEELAEAI